MDKTREKILISVKKCQALYGLKKMTVEDVANQAGLSRQTVYEKFGSKKRLVQDFLGWLGAESLAAVAQELRLRGADEEIPLAAAKSGIEVLYEGFAVGAPVQRESWARFLFEKDAPWWLPARAALQGFLQAQIWPENTDKADRMADFILRHLSSLLWQPVPPEEAAQNILPFLNQDGDAVSTSESSFEPEWD